MPNSRADDIARAVLRSQPPHGFHQQEALHAKQQQHSLQFTALLFACHKGHTSCALALIAKGANVDAPAKTGVTPLIEACRGGHAACAKALFPAPAADTRPENTALSQLETAHANWEKVTSYGINSVEMAWKFAVTLIIAVTCAAARAATAIGGGPMAVTARCCHGHLS